MIHHMTAVPAVQVASAGTVCFITGVTDIAEVVGAKMIKKAKELARMGLVGEIFANFTAQNDNSWQHVRNMTRLK